MGKRKAHDKLEFPVNRVFVYLSLLITALNGGKKVTAANRGAVNQSAVNLDPQNPDAVNQSAVNCAVVNQGAVNRDAVNRGTVNRSATNRGAVNRDAVNRGFAVCSFVSFVKGLFLHVLYFIMPPFSLLIPHNNVFCWVYLIRQTMVYVITYYKVNC